jgi:hypothetical protein
MRAMTAISFVLAVVGISAAASRALAEGSYATVFRCEEHDLALQRCRCPARHFPDRSARNEAVCSELWPPALLAPDDGAPAVEPPVELVVRPPRGASQIRFEICADPACARPQILTVPVTGERVSARLADAAAGQPLSWRARALHEGRGEATTESAWSARRQLTVAPRADEPRIVIDAVPDRTVWIARRPEPLPRTEPPRQPEPPPRAGQPRERTLGVLLGRPLGPDEQVSSDARLEGVLGVGLVRSGRIGLGLEASGWYDARRRSTSVRQYPGDPEKLGPSVDETLTGGALALAVRADLGRVTLSAGGGPAYQRFADAGEHTGQLGLAACAGVTVELQRRSWLRWGLSLRARVDRFEGVSVGEYRFTLAGAPAIERRPLKDDLAILSLGVEVWQ